MKSLVGKYRVDEIENDIANERIIPTANSTFPLTQNVVIA